MNESNTRFNSMSNLVENLDIFSDPLNFKVNGKKRFKTVIGGLIFFFLTGVFVLCVYIFGEAIFWNDLPFVYQRNAESSTPPEHFLSLNNFIFGIRLEDTNNTVINQADNSLFVFSALFSQYKRYYNGAFLQIENSPKSVPMVNCYDLYKQTPFCEDSFKSFICPDIRNTSIGGDWDSQFLNIIEITVEKCDSVIEAKNKIKCKPILGNDYFFTTLYAYNEVDPSNFTNPIQMKAKKQSIPITITKPQVSTQYFSVNQFYTDDGLFARNPTSSSYMQLERFEVNDNNFNSNKNIILTASMYTATERKEYYRFYKKIQTVIAEVVAFVQVVYYILKYINDLLSMLILKQFLYKNLFSFYAFDVEDESKINYKIMYNRTNKFSIDYLKSASLIKSKSQVAKPSEKEIILEEINEEKNEHVNQNILKTVKTEEAAYPVPTLFNGNGDEAGNEDKDDQNLNSMSAGEDKISINEDSSQSSRGEKVGISRNFNENAKESKEVFIKNTGNISERTKVVELNLQVETLNTKPTEVLVRDEAQQVPIASSSNEEKVKFDGDTKRNIIDYIKKTSTILETKAKANFSFQPKVMKSLKPAKVEFYDIICSSCLKKSKKKEEYKVQQLIANANKEIEAKLDIIRLIKRIEINRQMIKSMTNKYQQFMLENPNKIAVYNDIPVMTNDDTMTKLREAVKEDNIDELNDYLMTRETTNELTELDVTLYKNLSDSLKKKLDPRFLLMYEHSEEEEIQLKTAEWAKKYLNIL